MVFVRERESVCVCVFVCGWVGGWVGGWVYEGRPETLILRLTLPLRLNLTLRLTPEPNTTHALKS